MPLHNHIKAVFSQCAFAVGIPLERQTSTLGAHSLNTLLYFKAAYRSKKRRADTTFLLLQRIIIAIYPKAASKGLPPRHRLPDDEDPRRCLFFTHILWFVIRVIACALKYSLRSHTASLSKTSL
jgi:hypothetical protein